MSQTIWVANAFAKEPFKGNPAGVCFLDEFPEDAWMQDISTQLAFSNSAFVRKTADKQFEIKWFTPDSEAPICGHATIAATHVLFEEGLVNEGEEITFDSMAGKLYTSRIHGWYNLNFPAYLEMEERSFTKELEDIVNITPKFTGFSTNRLFMEFASEEELYSLKPNLELLKTIKCRALIATAKGNKHDFLSRYFAPSVGIDEDPVCASAHCILIPYWSKKLGKKDMLAYQASQRGGVIKCQNLGNRVLISGEAVTVYKGKISSTNLNKLKYAA